MAQFDVHRNRGSSRANIPFLLIIQSARFDRTDGRIVVPLILKDQLVSRDPHLNLLFVVEGREVVLSPLQIVTFPRDALGPKVANLADQGDDIIRALDLVISRAHG
jgi:toxin CcdB